MGQHIQRVVLVEAPQLWRTKDHTPPLGLGYLAAAVRTALPRTDVQILDASARELSVDETVRELSRLSPDVVGLTANSHNRFNVIDICRGIGAVRPRTGIVLGGPHFSYTAEDALEQIAEADVVVRGEGEKTFVELLCALNSGNRDALADVRGLSFRDGDTGRIIYTPDREPLEDINFLPAWDLFDHNRYHARLEALGEGRAVGVLSSRGCPFRCVFCANRNRYARHIRFRTPSHFVDELEHLNGQYGYRDFDIWDDTFTLRREHAEAVCREILRRRLNIRWYCLIRANTTDEALLSLMREAGCRGVGLGVESGSPTVLQSIRKDIRPDSVRKVTKAAVRVGLRVKAFFLHSLPDETLEDLRLTRELMYDLRSYSRRVRSIWAMTIVYPGTELEAMAWRRGWLGDGFSWNDRTPHCEHLAHSRGSVPYFSGAAVPPAQIAAFAKHYRPALTRRLVRPVKRLAMRLPFFHRLVQ